MLREISLKNFKCFREQVRIPLNAINLLTGINGRGKSTVLQALLLMRQSPEHSRTTRQIIFNGSCVELGSFDDVRNSAVSRTEAIELAFRFQRNDNYADLHYSLKGNPQDDMVADIDDLIVEGQFLDESFAFNAKLSMELLELPISSEPWHNLLPAIWFPKPQYEDTSKVEVSENQFVRDVVNFTQIHYISADRIGPRDYYLKQSFAEFPNVGQRGEYTANVLSKKKEDLVYELLRLPSDATHTVLDQTAAWLNQIFGGGKVNVQPLKANIVLMQLNSENSLELYRPVNVGFGYSYALPIIVSGLIAQAGEMLIVENPEAHLHPYAQAQIARFLAAVSACGVQVLVESHSEHILNGLRIAVLDKVINVNDLNVLYFQRDSTCPVLEIPVLENGAIEEWPDGFFDQTDKDFARLFGF